MNKAIISILFFVATFSVTMAQDDIERNDFQSFGIGISSIPVVSFLSNEPIDPFFDSYFSITYLATTNKPFRLRLGINSSFPKYNPKRNIYHYMFNGGIEVNIIEKNKLTIGSAIDLVYNSGGTNLKQYNQKVSYFQPAIGGTFLVKYQLCKPLSISSEIGAFYGPNTTILNSNGDKSRTSSWELGTHRFLSLHLNYYFFKK